MLSICNAVAIIFRRATFGICTYASLLATAFWAIRVLLLGDRNTFLLIIIVLVAGVFTFLVRASRLVMVVGAALALILYNGVEAARVEGPSVSALWTAIVSDSFARHPAGLDTSSFNITTITLRAGIAAVPDTYAYGYGWYKIVGLFGIVPLVRGRILGDGAPFSDSAYVLTRITIGPNAGWSVGTNVISDIQLDFGPIAVPVVMLVVGLLTGYARWRLASGQISSNAIAMYLVTVALVSELPRYALDFPVRIILWTAAILWVVRVISRRQSMKAGRARWQ
jgi:hypothetical protein